MLNRHQPVILHMLNGQALRIGNRSLPLAFLLVVVREGIRIVIGKISVGLEKLAPAGFPVGIPEQAILRRLILIQRLEKFLRFLEGFLELGYRISLGLFIKRGVVLFQLGMAVLVPLDSGEHPAKSLIEKLALIPGGVGFISALEQRHPGPVSDKLRVNKVAVRLPGLNHRVVDKRLKSTGEQLDIG